MKSPDLPVSFYNSTVGDTVHVVLIEAVTCDSEKAFSLGTRIDGRVVSVRKVGWGIRHETAALQLQFDRAIPTESSPVAMSAAVVEVEKPASRSRKT